MPKQVASESQRTPAASHERHCFCESCIGATLIDLIGERAELLDAALRDGLYTAGYERELAENLIHGIPADRRRAALDMTLRWDHLLPRVTGVDCLLDECDQRTYAAINAMGDVLLAAIDAQDAAPHALLVLIENEIEHVRKLLPLWRELDATARTK